MTGLPLVLAIRGYRKYLTRFTRACPNTPSCSLVGLQLAETYGTFRGGFLILQRLRGRSINGSVEDCWCGDLPNNSINGWDDCFTCTPGDY